MRYFTPAAQFRSILLIPFRQEMSAWTLKPLQSLANLFLPCPLYIAEPRASAGDAGSAIGN